MAVITGYALRTVQKWINSKKLKSVWTQENLITTKEWLLDFYCEHANEITIKSDNHIQLLERYLSE